MNWYTPCAYNDAQKRSFHATGRKRLKALAAALGLEAGSYRRAVQPRRHRRIRRSRPCTANISTCRFASRRPAGTAASSSAPARAARTTPAAPITSRRSHGSTISRQLAHRCRAVLAEEAGHETPHQRNPRQAPRQWPRTGQGQRHQGREGLPARRQALSTRLDQTWLLTELDPEDEDVAWGLCRAQHKPHYVEQWIMLNSLEKAPCEFGDPGNLLNIIFMLPTATRGASRC